MKESATPLVGIVMGSDSDWPSMKDAAQVLREFEVSAHRMPADMVTYGHQAAQRGIRVIIAGAGGAAHLPGMLAATTPLPVIGVPVPLKYLDGMDSLLSIVQMPGGVPVATVGVGNSKNAGLLAVRILSAGDSDTAVGLREGMTKYQALLRQVAIDKGEALNKVIEQGQEETHG